MLRPRAKLMDIDEGNNMQNSNRQWLKIIIPIQTAVVGDLKTRTRKGQGRGTKASGGSRD